MDEDDYERYGHLKWQERSGYICLRCVYSCIETKKIKDATYFMHRLVMGLSQSGNSKTVVDHINGDTTDNRKSNLRVVGRSENSINTTKRIKKETGIYKDKRDNMYTAYINHEGSRLNLLSTSNKQVALASYNIAKDLLHGNFGYRNLIKLNKKTFTSLSQLINLRINNFDKFIDYCKNNDISHLGIKRVRYNKKFKVAVGEKLECAPLPK